MFGTTHNDINLLSVQTGCRVQEGCKAMEGIDTLLTPKEVQKILKCSLPLVYKMAERGQIPCVRWECPGHGTERSRTMIRFKLSDVHEFVERHYNR